MKQDISAIEPSATDLADLQAGHRYACALTRDPSAAETLVRDAWVQIARDGDQEEGSQRLGSPRRLALFREIRELHFRKTRWQINRLSGKTLFGHCKDLETNELETIYLTTVEGFSAGQVSTFLQSPTSQVKDLLASGRAKLGRCFSRRLRTCN